MTKERFVRSAAAPALAWMCVAVLAFVHAGLVFAQDEDAGPEWPREITRPEGEIVIYQPQLETFDDNRLTARAAVSVQPSGSDEPVFGAIWLEAVVSTDRESRTVRLRGLEVSDAKFPHAEPEQIDRLSSIVEDEFDGSEMTVSLDRILTMLELLEGQHARGAELGHEPPVIRFVDHPSMLVTIDGAPELQPVGDEGVKRVVNTPLFIALDPDGGSYFMTDGMTWLSAPAVEGPWREARSVPKAVRSAAASAFGMVTVRPAPRGSIPEIIVVTEPTELIVTSGEPEYTPIEGTQLEWMHNADGDVYRATASQRHYLLISGRWYASDSLRGPWAWVPLAELPADFARIPPDTGHDGVLASVPGTQQATDASNDAAIPQTAIVDPARAALVVEYDGEPQFEPIDGTDMAYAVNTASDVIRLEGRYYCCDQAVWFEADDPLGPWSVCTSVPPEIDTLPQSCPLYHVRFVEVYGHDDDEVYVGYYPGYYGCYWYGGAIWYGTGRRYRAWRRHRYFTRPVTYGYGFRYDRHAGGWGSRARGSAWIPRSSRDDAWWGRGGYDGVGVARPARSGEAARAARNMYDRPRNRERTIDPQRDARAAQREAQQQERARQHRQHREERAARAERQREAREAREVRQRRNNVYADRDGNVHRRTGQGWERREPGGWSPQDRANAQRAADRYRALDRQYQARQRGGQRTYDYQRSRVQPAGGGGMRRGGGGGRRR